MGFADGFRTGANLVNQYRAGQREDEAFKLRQAEAARAEEQFGWQRAAQERAQKQASDLDGLTQQLRGLHPSQGYAPGTSLQAPPGYDPDMGPKVPEGLAEATAAIPSQGIKIAVPPTGAAATELMRNMALVKGDLGAATTLENRAKDQKWEEAFAGALQEYTGAPEQIGPTAKFMNRKSGSVTMGPPDKNGVVRISVVKPDDDATFLELSRPQQAQLYAAAKLMSVDPQRALSIMGDDE
jgi:hypothetical protein